jgi:hypothetical protein
MVNTRNHNINAENNNAANNNTENNNAANLPLTLEQILMMQAQMLQTMVNMQNAQHKHHPRHQEIDLQTSSTPSRLLSLISWNPWMLMTGSRL